MGNLRLVAGTLGELSHVVRHLRCTRHEGEIIKCAYLRHDTGTWMCKETYPLYVHSRPITSLNELSFQRY